MNSAFLCNVVSLIDPSGQQDLAADRYLKMSFKTLPSFNILQPAIGCENKQKMLRDLPGKTVHLLHAISTICIHTASATSFALKLQAHKNLLKLTGDFQLSLKNTHV